MWINTTRLDLFLHSLEELHCPLFPNADKMVDGSMTCCTTSMSRRAYSGGVVLEFRQGVKRIRGRHVEAAKIHKVVDVSVTVNITVSRGGWSRDTRYIACKQKKIGCQVLLG